MIHRPSPSRLRRPLPWAGVLTVALLALVTAGCGGSGQQTEPDTAQQARTAETLKSEKQAVFAPAWSTNAEPPPEAGGIRVIGSLPDGVPAGALGNRAPRPAPAPAGGPVDKSAANWTIALAVFRGDTSADDAANALPQVKAQLPGAYIQRRGPATLIAYGAYSGAGDPKAQSDMSRIQSIQADGASMFAGAYLCPPFQGQVGAMGEYDLRRARQQYGAAALYTLQVGWYGREDLPKASEADLKDARKAAEDAAARLRREGELAFYFHGPNRSMVTVGVFDQNDFDPQTRPGMESTRLRESRKRHPLNLYNGAGYSYKSAGMRESKLLPSGLVAIPTR